jgi:hypothetical protein
MLLFEPVGFSSFSRQVRFDCFPVGVIVGQSGVDLR